MSTKRDVISITRLKNDAAELVRSVSEDGRTLIVTQNGAARVAVIDVAELDRMRDALALLKMIAQGEAAFSKALDDPETLVTIVGDGGVELEAIYYVSWRAYENRIGSEFPHEMLPSKKLIGDDWEEDDLERMFPRLCAKFWAD